jgi:hypothetical protein
VEKEGEKKAGRSVTEAPPCEKIEIRRKFLSFHREGSDDYYTTNGQGVAKGV